MQDFPENPDDLDIPPETTDALAYATSEPFNEVFVRTCTRCGAKIDPELDTYSQCSLEDPSECPDASEMSFDLDAATELIFD